MQVRLEGCTVSPLNQHVSVFPISNADIEEVIKSDVESVFAKTKDGRYFYAERQMIFVGSTPSEVIQWGFTQKARDKWNMMF